MVAFKSIEGIEDGEIELLEAAGFSDVRELATVEPEALHAELVKANSVLGLLDAAPGIESVRAWVGFSRQTTEGNTVAPQSAVAGPAVVSIGVVQEASVEVDEVAEAEAVEESEPVVEPEPVPQGPVNFEADPDVQDMLDRAPVALPIPNRLLMEQGIRPSEIEPAEVLNRAVSDLEVAVASNSKKPAPGSIGKPRGKAGGLKQVADFRSGTRLGIDSARVRSIDDVRDEPLAEPSKTEQAPVDERVRLIRTARESTNRGKDPNSRWFIRGVLHDRPFLVWFGCVIFILFQLAVPLGLVAAPLLMLSDHPSNSFAWVPSWVIAFPIAIPVFGLLYFAVSCRVKCRVCGQKVLMPRKCLKNRKAHHIPGIGYILPLAVHTILFRWFNCTFCGTSVRIKE
ncbi:ferredoxin [Haloferula helveola]|uniref:Ferredoxin n=1 Tax=Haloferula helveola TaxID=490095 RepID=A0ABN6HHC1_9BACT|nr:ferredoxin [Haloferula helveola]